jgi:hypothetical protein
VEEGVLGVEVYPKEKQKIHESFSTTITYTTLNEFKAVHIFVQLHLKIPLGCTVNEISSLIDDSCTMVSLN